MIAVRPNLLAVLLALLLAAMLGCHAMGQQPTPAKEVTVEDLQKLYWQAKGFACGDCSGSGKRTCDSCHGVDKSQQPCPSCHGVDQTKTPCWSCKGVDQTKTVCWSCKGVDQTTQSCWSCKGVDQTKTDCWSCKGNGRGLNGARCYSCSGSGKNRACVYCHGKGKNNPCAYCRGRGTNSACTYCRGRGTNSQCFTCRGSGKDSPCFACRGKSALGGVCETCAGEGSVEVLFAAHKSGDELILAVAKFAADEETKRDTAKVLKRDEASRYVAENSSYYGEISADTGHPKVVFVDGYFRKDGTYVQSHYRSLPLGGVSARGPPLRVYTPTDTTYAPRYAENGSYYGQLNSWGAPKTVHVGGYFRKDGNYVRGHYRSRPRR